MCQNEKELKYGNCKYDVFILQNATNYHLKKSMYVLN